MQTPVLIGNQLTLDLGWHCSGQSRFLLEGDLSDSHDSFLGYIGFFWDIVHLVLLACNTHILGSCLRAPLYYLLGEKVSTMPAQ